MWSTCSTTVVQLDWKALIPEEPIGINTIHHTETSHFYFDWLDRDRMVIRALTIMAAQEVQFKGLTKSSHELSKFVLHWLVYLNNVRP